MNNHLIAAARARLAEHGRCSPVMQEMGAVLDALDSLTAENDRLCSQQRPRSGMDIAQERELVFADKERKARWRAIKDACAVPIVGEINVDAGKGDKE